MKNMTDVFKTLFKQYKFTKNETTIMYLVISFIITIICFGIQPDSDIRYILGFKLTNYIVLLLNFVPIFLLVTILGNILNNIFLSSGISSAILFSASVVNRYKIIYRDEPFMPLDITIYAEALDAITNMDYSINIFLFLTLFILCALQFFAAYKFKPYIYKRKIKAISIAFLIFLAITLNVTIYSKSNIYSWLPNAVTEFRASDNFNSKGFVYSFIYTFNTDKVHKPKEYSINGAEEILKQYSQFSKVALTDTSELERSTISTQPNIIFVLSEAFMDVSKFDNLTFEDDQNVLENYSKIKETAIVSGDIVVPGFGGATSSTEFEVLTGISSSLLENGGKNPFDAIKSSIISVPSVLKTSGYGTLAIHPGYGWFYNRSNAYRYLSFDNTMFIDSFDSVNNIKGIYISEQATFDKLKEQINFNVENESKPFFYNLVTIQNHGPYNEGRYADSAYNFSTKVPISDSSKIILTNYLYGLKDADTELGKLTEYLNSLEEPFILVYYSDHLPYLGPDYQVYKELEFNILQNDTYVSQALPKTSSYLIWGNSSAKEYLNEDYIKSLNNEKNISSNFLPILTLNILGMNNIHPYYSYLSDIFAKYDIISNNIYMKDNTAVYPLTVEQQKEISDYGIVGYYQYKDQSINENKKQE